MPAVQAEIRRTNSQRSNHSAASSGNGSKLGAWLRKKRGFSVSSSTSGGRRKVVEVVLLAINVL